MSDILFSCRNCIHNSAQSISIGKGAGFCLKFNSVLPDSAQTTCKYLHRKDLPSFVVEEGIREHAKEFAFFSGMVSLKDMKPLRVARYSEKFAWERGTFDPQLHAFAQYHKMQPHWIMVQAFAGGIDGLRAAAHASLVRHYLDTCGKWQTSYRLVLALLQELDVTPQFEGRELVPLEGEAVDTAKDEGLWEVVFSRLSGLQEYGWHAGIKDLTWITDSLNGALSSFDWARLKPHLSDIRVQWTSGILQHAKDNQVFFPAETPESETELLEGEP